MARILVIEDNASFRETLKEMLERKNHQVITAEDGDKGLQAIKSNPVDLVITDIIMPVKDGVTTIQDIQREFPAAKIIAMSGGGAINKGETYLEATMFITHIKHVLQKPFSGEVLFQTIEKVLG